MSARFAPRRLLAAGFGLATLAAANAAASAPASLFAKPSVGRVELQAQGRMCLDEARGAKPRNPAYMPTSAPNAYAAAGAALAVGILQGMEEAKAQNAYVEACLRGAGYARVPLTPNEEAQLKAAKGEDARNAFYDAFLAQDLTARIEAALVPAVPPFAPAAAEPYAIGGLKLDPATIVVAPQGVAPKQALLTARAVHRRTAVLKADFRLGDMFDIRAEAGAVFHQVSYAADPKGGYTGDTQWCGPVRNNSIYGRISMPYCIWASFEGYQIALFYDHEATDWLKGDGAPIYPPGLVKGSTLTLEESPTDLIGPVDLVLNLVRLTKAGAEVKAVATRDGKRVSVWSGFVNLENGAGALPFWDKRLMITRTGKVVHSELVDGGDGRGWLDPPPAAPAE
jgi:hypothetical protein